jgi:nicotinate-nucleotide adenylyltransferase
VRWVPSGQPGHRGAPIASAADRLSMLRAALANHARIRRDTGAETPLVLIIGGDQFLGLETWKDWRHLFDLAHIAVAERPGHAIDTAHLTLQLAAEYASRAADSVSAQPAGTIIRFPMAALDISSTAVRQLIASGRSPRYLLPESVLEYIHARHLYRKVST